MKKFELIAKDFPHFLHGGDYNPDQWLATPEVINEDMRLMREAGCNEMTVGIFAWSELEPEEGIFNFGWLDDVLDKIYHNGGRVVLATPSGAKPKWMTDKYPEILRVQEDGVRDRFGHRHNHCRTSPVYREKVRIINEKLAARYGKHPAVVAWHLSNEYNGEMCYCENCVAGFRAWLQEKYGNDIERLNLVWWSEFWSHKYQSFSQIEPPREHGGERHMQGLSLDWKRFVSDMTVDFAAREAEVIRRYSDRPITTNCMCHYTGYDHYKMARVLDVASNDFYPRWSQGVERVALTQANLCALYRGMKGGRPFMVMESAPGINLGGMTFSKVKTDAEQFFEAMLFVACGADTVQYFQWRKSRGGAEKLHGAVVDHYGKTDNRVFQNVKRIGEALPRLAGVLGTGVRADMAVLWDYETMWALDGNPTQSRRAPTALVQSYLDMHKGFFRAAWQRNIPADVVSYDTDLSKYKLVCLPVPYLMTPMMAARLKDYVRGGGVLISTYLTAMADESDLCYLGGVPGADLRRLFGLRVDEVDNYHAPAGTVQRHTNSVVYGERTYPVERYAELICAEGAEVLARFTDNIQAGAPAVLCHTYGAGRAYYIGYHPDEAFLRDFMNDVMNECGLQAPAEVQTPADVRAICREGDGERYLFLLNCADEARRVTLSDSYPELLSDTTLSGEQTLPPLGVMVLRV